MTKKYTAADFANARFAEHADGRTAMKSSGQTRWDVKFLNGHIAARDDYHMASFGWVPVPTKPTITELIAAFNELSKDLKNRTTILARELERARIAIVPDPEPTDEELLAGIIRNIDDWQSITSPELLAKYLNTAGVTVNEENN